jgi:hypothetical protein
MPEYCPAPLTPSAFRLWKTFRSQPNTVPVRPKSVRLQTGIAFAFDRIPHLIISRGKRSGTSRKKPCARNARASYASWARMFRRCWSTGVRARQFRGDSSRTPEAELREVRLRRAGGSTESPDRARPSRAGAVGACAGVEVLHERPLCGVALGRKNYLWDGRRYASAHGSVLRGKSEGMGDRMQQGREPCISIFLPVNLGLRVSQAAGTTSRIAISFAHVIVTPAHS